MGESAGGIHLYTLGHSTRGFEEFVQLLRENGVSTVADIRTVPRSRRNPQFNRETMAEALQPYGIKYRHLESLGGLRRPRPDSPNTAWENLSFRGFADYILTQQFEEGLRELLGLAGEETTAMMCAEAVPWRCHRSLIADVLTVRGIQVTHILSERRSQAHRLTPFAVVLGSRVLYPGTDGAAE
jgi:uncharacterized protein (DUF488 family)